MESCQDIEQSNFLVAYILYVAFGAPNTLSSISVRAQKLCADIIKKKVVSVRTWKGSTLVPEPDSMESVYSGNSFSCRVVGPPIGATVPGLELQVQTHCRITQIAAHV